MARKKVVGPRGKDTEDRHPHNSLKTIKANQPGPGTTARKHVLWGFTNNKDADQPAHPRSLISAFVVCLLDSITNFSSYSL